ncbi:MAG: hypothetical protein ACOX2M_06345 [Fastidiosipilaceae bacterium]|jgi:hypothetical protein
MQDHNYSQVDVQRVWQTYAKKEIRQGLEGGLNLAKFAYLQCSEQFIDKSAGCLPLGVREDDIDAAIGESVQLSLKILERTMTDIVDRKAQ